MKVLITGAAGAIGNHLTNYIAKLGHDVIAVDNFIRSVPDETFKKTISSENVSFINLDLSDRISVNELPNDVDLVFHLAAMNGTQNFYDFPFDVLTNSTLPTINLLAKFSESKSLKRFVYAGSSESYASTVTNFGWPVPTSEDVPLSISDPMNPRWSYGASKLHGEVACFSAATQFNIPVTVARYHNVYGPRMGDKHVIPDFINRAKNGIYELHGYEDTRSFIYVSDAVEATYHVALEPELVNSVVNIGGDLEISMLELGKLILKLMEVDADIACYPSPLGSVKRRAPSLEKLYNEIKFRPSIDLESGLQLMLDSYNLK